LVVKPDDAGCRSPGIGRNLEEGALPAIGQTFLCRGMVIA
jgi:hypothetical protein